MTALARAVKISLIVGAVLASCSTAPVPAGADTSATSADVCSHYFPTSNPSFLTADGSVNPVVVTGHIEAVCVSAPDLTIDMSRDASGIPEVDIYSDATRTTVLGGGNYPMLQVLIKSDESDCWAGVTCSAHAPAGSVVMGGPESDNVENAGDAWGCTRTGLPCDGTGGIGSATVYGAGGNDRLTFHEDTSFPNTPLGQQQIYGQPGADSLATICTKSDGSTSTACEQPPAGAMIANVLTYHVPRMNGGNGNDHITDRIRNSVVFGGKGKDVCRVVKTVKTNSCETVIRVK